MAFHSGSVLIIVASFLLLAFSGESHVQDHPGIQEGNQPAVSDSSLKHVVPTLPTIDVNHWLNIPADEQARLRSYLKANMEASTTKIKDFITRVISKRDQKSSNGHCLKKCNEAYEAAIVAMQKGINDISHDNYYQTTADVHEFSVHIQTCTDCFGKMIVEDPEFKQFQDWANSAARDYTDRLQKYID